MEFNQVIPAFVQLGHRLSLLRSDERASVLQKAELENRWFTAENLQTALANIQSGYLDEARLRQWLLPYAAELQQPREAKKLG
ncbi:MAG: hypothetical protein HC913_22700 [Microscillaceae bacterium]|nr:hypothetical protein [Microscillaceae bacterium]